MLSETYNNQGISLSLDLGDVRVEESWVVLFFAFQTPRYMSTSVDSLEKFYSLEKSIRHLHNR